MGLRHSISSPSASSSSLTSSTSSSSHHHHHHHTSRTFPSKPGGIDIPLHVPVTQVDKSTTIYYMAPTSLLSSPSSSSSSLRSNSDNSILLERSQGGSSTGSSSSNAKKKKQKQSKGNSSGSNASAMIRKMGTAAAVAAAQPPPPTLRSLSTQSLASFTLKHQIQETRKRIAKNSKKVRFSLVDTIIEGEEIEVGDEDDDRDGGGDGYGYAPPYGYGPNHNNPQGEQFGIMVDGCEWNGNGECSDPKRLLLATQRGYLPVPSNERTPIVVSVAAASKASEASTATSNTATGTSDDLNHRKVYWVRDDGPSRDAPAVHVSNKPYEELQQLESQLRGLAVISRSGPEPQTFVQEVEEFVSDDDTSSV